MEGVDGRRSRSEWVSWDDWVKAMRGEGLITKSEHELGVSSSFLTDVTGEYGGGGSSRGPRRNYTLDEIRYGEL